MPIFKISGTKLKKLNSLPLDKEKNLQALVEANLIEVLDLLFLATEYTTTFGGRIDTLAVDTNGSPVIIEYKRNKNDNVINQSLSYLKWLKSQKPGFFEKLMIDKLGKDKADKIKLDWHNPRVICVAENYSKFDIDTAEVVPLRIELMKYRYYEEGIFALEPVNVPETAATTHAPIAVAFAGVGRTAVGASRSLARPTRRRLRALVAIVAPWHWSGAARCVAGQWPAASRVVCAPAHPCASPLRGISPARWSARPPPVGAPSARASWLLGVATNLVAAYARNTGATGRNGL